MFREFEGFREIVIRYPEIIVIVNILLRMKTGVPLDLKIKSLKAGFWVLVVALLLLSSCSQYQVLDPTEGLFYKRDIKIEINDTEYIGVTTVPFSREYHFKFTPAGDVKKILFKTCHREVEEGEIQSGGLFKKQGKWEYIFLPRPGIEDSGLCPATVDVYDVNHEQHGWARIEFENSRFKLQYSVDCNGVTRHVNGIGVCQSKEGLYQRLKFKESVRFAAPSEGCAMPSLKDGYHYLKLSPGECVYTFDTKGGNFGKMTMIGYQGLLLRGKI